MDSLKESLERLVNIRSTVLIRLLLNCMEAVKERTLTRSPRRKK